ncbi:hypothetical protein GCK72_020950 [Caenorhabditis remanei]|uniref:Zap1-like C2H2 zinc finger 1 domain-containing protein n=1 Tax=Caenorhabditis remanei TaxID=31234 RepID=A0A6A5GJ20_CAERE|nr:hypothetical protein GCK72_020950 [Caenorhabditis remanei]KAF1754389.1 hypothetical protein GCK72_020950 [Caenorhabditis remanei]
MSETTQNITCKWSGCTHRFGSEVDMNMHVMMNHMILLNYGDFVLKKPLVNRKRPAEPQPEPSPEISEVSPVVRQLTATVKVESRPPEVAPESIPIPPKKPVKPDSSSSAPLPIPPISIPPNLEVPIQSRQVAENLQNFFNSNWNPTAIEMDSDATSLQNGDVLEQMDAIMAAPQKLSDVIDEILERLRPMKQLGFIRETRPVYCLICLKYVKSFHECNWKHTPAEDRIAEMWYRRFGKERPNGKNQLMKELLEVKGWILEEEEAGNLQDINL